MVTEGTSANNMLRLFKDVVTEAAEKIMYRACNDSKEGNALWTSEMKEITKR